MGVKSDMSLVLRFFKSFDVWASVFSLARFNKSPLEPGIRNFSLGRCLTLSIDLFFLLAVVNFLSLRTLGLSEVKAGNLMV